MSCMSELWVVSPESYLICAVRVGSTSSTAASLSLSLFLSNAISPRCDDGLMIDVVIVLAYHQLEAQMPALGIRSYGIGVTTMEEVFLKVATTVADRENGEEAVIPMPEAGGEERGSTPPAGGAGSGSVKRISNGSRSTGVVTVDVKPWPGRAGALLGIVRTCPLREGLTVFPCCKDARPSCASCP